MLAPVDDTQFYEFSRIDLIPRSFSLSRHDAATTATTTATTAAATSEEEGVEWECEHSKPYRDIKIEEKSSWRKSRDSHSRSQCSCCCRHGCERPESSQRLAATTKSSRRAAACKWRCSSPANNEPGMSPGIAHRACVRSGISYGVVRDLVRHGVYRVPCAVCCATLVMLFLLDLARSLSLSLSLSPSLSLSLFLSMICDMRTLCAEKLKNL